MRTKLTLTMLYLVVLLSCQNKKKTESNSNISEKDCIDKILLDDSKLGKIRNHECETITLQKTIDNYVKAMRKLNFEGCPEEFSVAFKKHISAWNNMGKFTENYPELRGEMHDLFDSIEKSKDSATFKPLL
ncbi:hypothetical protein [Winogradskyella pulchriflava]|uniref:Lipoprotein n=1 Tax=Winogradskyella pulchriflava TaxID=1110688 RepID=A0ABV6QE54_9FLAO